VDAKLQRAAAQRGARPSGLQFLLRVMADLPAQGAVMHSELIGYPVSLRKAAQVVRKGFNLVLAVAEHEICPATEVLVVVLVDSHQTARACALVTLLVVIADGLARVAHESLDQQLELASPFSLDQSTRASLAR